jgi:hypothetical protein
MEFLTGVAVIIGFWVIVTYCLAASGKRRPGAPSPDEIVYVKSGEVAFAMWRNDHDRDNSFASTLDESPLERYVRQGKDRQPAKPAKPTRAQRAYARRQQEIAEANAAAERFAARQQSLGLGK